MCWGGAGFEPFAKHAGPFQWPAWLDSVFKNRSCQGLSLIEGDESIQDAKDSEKDMEKKFEGAMEQVKILNIDFGKECADRKTLVKEAVSRIK